MSTSSLMRRKTVSISVSIKDGHILVIRKYTDYSTFLFLSAILIGFYVLAVLFVEMPRSYAPEIIILLIAHFLFKDRPIKCIVDKQREQIDYFQKGLLGLSLFENNVHCSTSEIKQLTIQRYRHRYGVSYKIILVLNDGQKLPLSSNRLKSIHYCKRFANKFCHFLERDIPIKVYKSFIQFP